MPRCRFGLSMPAMTDEACRARSNRCMSHQSSIIMALAAQDVTKAQAKERANARSLHNQHTLDRYIVPGSPPTKSSSQSAAGKPHHPLNGPGTWHIVSIVCDLCF